MPKLTNRFGISALSKGRYQEAIPEELMVDKDTGQILVKNINGDISSYDTLVREAMIVDKLQKKLCDVFPANIPVNADIVRLQHSGETVENNIKYPFVIKEKAANIPIPNPDGYRMPYKINTTHNNFSGGALLSMYFDISMVDRLPNNTLVTVMPTAEVEMILVTQKTPTAPKVEVTFKAKVNDLNSNIMWNEIADIHSNIKFPNGNDSTVTYIKSIKFTNNEEKTKNAYMIIHGIYLIGDFDHKEDDPQAHFPLAMNNRDRYNYLSILASAIGPNLSDYDSTKTYKKGDIIYHFDYDDGSYNFLSCIEDNVSGAFNDSKWKKMPDGFVPGLKTSGADTSSPLAFIKRFDTLEEARNALRGSGISTEDFGVSEDMTILEYNSTIGGHNG